MEEHCAGIPGETLGAAFHGNLISPLRLVQFEC
jgi:hypothetical protein